jgi:hypothetical protein
MGDDQQQAGDGDPKPTHRDLKTVWGESNLSACRAKPQRLDSWRVQPAHLSIWLIGRPFRDDLLTLILDPTNQSRKRRGITTA